jgi:hypothetical protein
MSKRAKGLGFLPALAGAVSQEVIDLSAVLNGIADHAAPGRDERFLREPASGI